MSSWQVGVLCPLCKAGADQQCITKSGNPYQERCHAARRRAALDQGVELVWRTPPPPTEQEREETTRAARIKMALWYIQKAGGVEPARKAFNAACRAMEE